MKHVIVLSDKLKYVIPFFLTDIDRKNSRTLISKVNLQKNFVNFHVNAFPRRVFIFKMRLTW